MIRYRGGYKYQLVEDYSVWLPIAPPNTITTEYITLTSLGILSVHSGYAWDGPSGPTIDTKNFMRGSLVHDALYQLMRERFLPETFRARADVLLRDLCLEDGMWRIRAWWVYQGVRFGGGPAAAPKNVKPVLEAP